MQNNVTLFEGFIRPVAHLSLYEVLLSIKEGKYKQQVETIRSNIQGGNHEHAALLKKRLPGFTSSGQFLEGRKRELLIRYSSYIILDLDKLNEQLTATFQQVIGLPYTRSCFISPSGNGLKIIVEVDTNSEMHELAFETVCNYYETSLGVAIDKSGRDVCRLCFVSYDPDLFINPVSSVFQVQPQATESNYLQSKETFEQCVKMTNAKLNYVIGNRNNYIHLLACYTNRCGISIAEALSLVQQSFDLDSNELQSIIEGVYGRNQHEFGKQDFLEEQAKSAYQTPFIPEEIFEQLPDYLKKGTYMFQSHRERDVFLTGALTILSGVIGGVEGVYDQHTVYPNLFCFIVAPAASGKGVLSYAKQLGLTYHKKLVQESKELRKRYEAELQLHKSQQIKQRKGEPLEVEPVEPPFKILYIPGNSSSSAIIQHLEESNSRGIFCETEADTLNNSLKQDWGNFSDLLRRVFHHEPVDKSRKTSKEYVHIEKPRLSVALSGTPVQVLSLIKSAENGLFSRFMYYQFNDNPKWKDVSPSQSKPNLTKYFETLAQEVLPLVEFYDRYPITFDLTEQQWRVLNEYGDRWLKEIVVFTGREASSMVKRLGLIMFRIAMTLTALRKFEDADTSPHVICEDMDFATAFKLTEVYLRHGTMIFKELPKKESVIDQFIKKFYDRLPDNFNRQQAVVVGKSYNIQERTVDGYLKKLCDADVLVKTTYGQYEKS